MKIRSPSTPYSTYLRGTVWSTIEGLGVRVQGLGFRVSGKRVWGRGFMVAFQGSFSIAGLGSRL